MKTATNNSNRLPSFRDYVPPSRLGNAAPQKRAIQIRQVKSCLDCEVFLRSHPSLRQAGITELAKDKSGQWFHVSPNGKKLHKVVIEKSKATKRNRALPLFPATKSPQ